MSTAHNWACVCPHSDLKLCYQHKMEKLAFGKFWLVFVQWEEVETHHLYFLFIYISDPQ